MQKLQGTAMEVLVEGNKLMRADVLVTHTKGSLLGWLIRRGTDSYWNHALMVYVVRDHKQGYDTTFIIESGGAGIDIHNIEHYFKNPKKYDVAVKRWEPDWLEKDTSGDKLRYSRRIRGFALGEIDDRYDHRMILEIAERILRQAILAGHFFVKGLTRGTRKKVVNVSKISKNLNINAYICSGFVQWAYYQGLSRIIDEEKQDISRLQDVLFNPRLTEVVTDDDLLSTTPADIANSNKLKWKYVIKNEDVFEVSNQEEVDEIIGWGKSRSKKK
jgi:hypothetical protein